VIEDPVNLVDVAPTILGLLGIPAPERSDGIDLTGYWRAPDSIPSVRVLYASADHNNEAPDMHRMVRVGPHKLRYDRYGGSVELYDLIEDPEERKDLSQSSPDRLAALMARIHAYMDAEQPGIGIDPLTAEEIEKFEKLGYTR